MEELARMKKESHVNKNEVEKIRQDQLKFQRDHSEVEKYKTMMNNMDEEISTLKHNLTLQ